MPVSILDPRAALLVVDLQRGIAGNPAVAPIVERAAALADSFRAADLPVVLINVEGISPGRTERARPTSERAADWAEVLPELGDGFRVTKHNWGAFHGTELDGILRGEDVTQVFVAGVATSMGVESTARAAREHGYHVVVVTDAVADANPTAHAHSIEHIFPAIGETGTTAEIIRLVDLPRTPRQ